MCVYLDYFQGLTDLLYLLTLYLLSVMCTSSIFQILFFLLITDTLVPSFIVIHRWFHKECIAVGLAILISEAKEMWPVLWILIGIYIYMGSSVKKEVSLDRCTDVGGSCSCACIVASSWLKGKIVRCNEQTIHDFIFCGSIKMISWCYKGGSTHVFHCIRYLIVFPLSIRPAKCLTIYWLKGLNMFG